MFEVPVWAVGVGFIILAGTIAKVIARIVTPADQLRLAARVRGRLGKFSTRDFAELVDELQRRLGELDELRKRLDEVEEVQRRLGEVEERLDFAERLLTKQREEERERLAPPQG
jgi:predicted nuclease with TOPRIM domain